jgi:cystathionine beta-synthase
MDSTKDTSKCTWKLGDKIENSPHHHEPFRAEPKKIYDDVLDAIGNTPMIKINKLGKNDGIECELLAKCEFMNMGGSVKVRALLCRTASVNAWFWTLRSQEFSRLETPS